MTIDEIKRALVEVKEICNKADYCGICPFGCSAGCLIGMTIPGNWELDDWEEDSNETD